MTPNYTITKSNIELYKFRKENGDEWADITIDENGTTGRISIASNWGSWQNYWDFCGRSFKEFLTKLNCEYDCEYVANKFGVGRCFDLEKTINFYKNNIIEARRIDRIDENKARTLFDSIKSIHDDYVQ